MKKTYFDLLSTLFSCLEEMKINCQEHNWALLAKNEEQREETMKKLRKLQPENSADVIALTKKVIQLNNDVIEVANRNKDGSEKALLEIKRNIKKTSLYQ